MAALKLCMLTSEMLPFAKTGGLADVAGALVRELALLGHEVRAFMPLYAHMRGGPWDFRPEPAVQAVPIDIGGTPYEFSLLLAPFPGTALSVHFIDCPRLYDRAAFYTDDPDEHRRFLLLTRATLESCRLLGYRPNIYQCNDWHAAFLPLLLKTVYAADPSFHGSRSVLTIHNIGYQGIMPAAAVADLGVGAGESLLDREDLANGVINALKCGIRFADAVTTVSPTYAREIREGPLGMGMQSALRARPDEVTGILNGVDYHDWDPRRDPYLTEHFAPESLAGKAANKRRLLADHAFTVGASTPLISMVTRLAEQKGIDLLFDVLPDLLAGRDCALIVLGSGERRYVTFFETLALRFPGRVVFRSGYDEPLAHQIEAGSDIFLMPSRYEPCGLNQMYSLRYGTIPIVHKTGGLADSVQPFNAAAGTGTGCLFNDYNASAVRWALDTTLDWFADPASWARLMQNAMAQDFSWTRQVARYEALFRSLTDRA